MLTHARSQGVTWGGKLDPSTTGYQLFATHGNFLVMFYCCCIFLPKERSPEMLVELNLGLCDILASSIFSYKHIVNLIVTTESMK